MCTIANCNGRVRRRMTREEYTIRGAHVGGGAGIQDPGMLALEMHLIECSDKTILVPHGSWWRDVERRKCRGGYGGAKAV